MTRCKVKVPSKATLKKYGLSIKEWRNLLQLQGSVCFICEKVPPSNRLCIDHLHVKGFKKMKPEKRKQFVRGLICTHCNYRLVHKSMTLPKARNIVKYLERFEYNLYVFKESN